MDEAQIAGIKPHDDIQYDLVHDDVEAESADEAIQLAIDYLIEQVGENFIIEQRIKEDFSSDMEIERDDYGFDVLVDGVAVERFYNFTAKEIEQEKEQEVLVLGLYRNYRGEEYIYYFLDGNKYNVLTNGVKCWSDDKDSKRIETLEQVETINIERIEKRIGRNRPGHNAKQALEAVKSMQQHTQLQAVPVKK